MPELFVRPVPNEFEEAAVKAGKRRANVGVSSSWFTVGGYGVDARGLYLVDAGGVRHDLPTPPGAQLLRIRHYGQSMGSATSGGPELILVDEQHHRLADLPVYVGFQHFDFGPLARAAGIEFLEPEPFNIDVLGPDCGFPSSPETLHLQRSELADADRHKLSHLFRRRSGKGTSAT